MDYKQPDFYHFNDDSIFLAKYIGKHFSGKTDRLLDLCAGSGIIGIEVARELNKIERCSFIELQSEFIEFLKFNTAHFLPEKVIKIYHSDFRNLNIDEKFDLIVINPPYFIEGRGRVAADTQRQRCRYINKNGPTELIQFILKSLTLDGAGYILIPKGIEEWEEVKKVFSNELRLLHSLVRADIYLILQRNTDK